MAAPRVVIKGRPSSRKKASSLLLGGGPLCFSDSSSSDDELDEDDEEEDRHDSGEAAYINLMQTKSRTSSSRGRAGVPVGGSECLKRHRKLLGFCHQFCYVFVVLSGFLVLITLAWLHFSLRAQSQDLSAQLRQG